MSDALAVLVMLLLDLLLRPFGFSLERLRRRIDRTPDRNFSQATPLQKAGRLIVCAAVLAGIGGPLIWLVFR